MWGLVNEGTKIVATMIIFVLLGRTLGPETYGAYVGLFALLIPFQPFTGQGGVPLTMYEFIVRNGEDPVHVVRSCFSVGLVGAGVLTPFVVWYAQGTVSDTMTTTTIVLFVLSELVAGTMTMTMIAVLQAVVGFGLAARRRAMAQAVRLGIVVGLYLFDSLTLGPLAVAMFAGRAFYLAVVYREASQRLGVWVAPRRPRSHHVRSALTYAVGQSAVGFQSGWGPVTLNRTGQARDAGLLGAAQRVVNLGQTPLRALIGSTHLTFLDPRKNKVRLAVRLTTLSLAFTGVFVLVLLFAAPLVGVVLGDEFEDSIGILRWLIPFLVLRACTIWPMNAIMGLGRNTARTVLQVAAAVFAVALYQLLVPDRGWEGAVMAATITEGAVVASAWTMLWHYQRRERRDQAAPVGVRVGSSS